LAQPTAYNRLKNFVQYALAHTSQPFNAADHDAELNAIETTLDEVLANLALIQRDDGYLKNASVHVDAFSTASLALIAADWTPQGLWATTTVYAVGDVVQESTSSYVCATAHTSGTFATDYAAGKWIILGATAGSVASGISCSAYGHIASTNVQAFLEELVDEKARLAGSTSQTFDVGDATDDTHALSMGQAQKDSVIYVGAAGGSSDALTGTLVSGLTALTGGMRVRVKATAANTTTAPTFNLTLGSTATGAKTIKKGAAAALIVGDIAGSGHVLELVYESTADCWLLQNPAYAPGTSTDALDTDSVRNLGIAFSVGSGALTASLKSGTGGTPSASDAVQVAMRSATASTGTYATRSVTAALTLTVRSGDTLGHESGVEEPLHWYLIDNSGTLELAVSTKYFGQSGIVSTTAISGGALTSATTMYSSSARTSVGYRWIARTLDTQTTAGTWASNPTSTALVVDAPKLVENQNWPHSIGRNITGQNNATNPNYQFDWNADEFVVKNSAGAAKLLSTVDVTVDITASGANGLDTGSEANSTWYYGHIIYNPTTDTVAGLLSLSWTSPTLPSGYTFSAPIGAVYNESTGNIRTLKQRGAEVFSNSTLGILINGTATSSAPVSLAIFIPPIALTHKTKWSMEGTTDVSGNVSANLILEYVSGTGYAVVVGGLYGLTPSHAYQRYMNSLSTVEMPNVSQTMYYYHQVGTGTNHLVNGSLHSFTLPIGGQ